MPHQKVRILSSTDALRLGRDAKIVAIRWDIVPWGLVLDCDAPVKEDVENPQICRAWVVFNGMNEISWSVESVRLPNGIFGTNAVVASECFGGFCRYELSVLAPAFSGNKLNNNPNSKIIITAKGLVGLASIATSQFGEFGPDRQQRNSLATDDEFLQAIGDVQNTVADGSRGLGPIM